jgi:hypothetical protein
MTPSYARQLLDRQIAKRQLAEAQIVEEIQALQEARQHSLDVSESVRIVQESAEIVQTIAHQRIAGIVSQCLHAIFADEAYTFKIDFKQARGKTEAHLLLVRDDLEIDALDASGGGVVDVVSFALRLACLVLSTPRKRAVQDA